MDIDQVMQAAERLRRCKTEDPANVYPDCPHSLVDMQADEGLLADFALSILPKGKRPVAIMQPRTCNYPTEPHPASAVSNGVAFPVWCCCELCRSTFNVPTKYYRTEAEAHLAVHWHKFDELVAVA